MNRYRTVIIARTVLLLVLVVSAGASGGLFGLVGAMSAIYARYWRELPEVMRRGLRSWLTTVLLYNAVFLLVPAVDGAAHGVDQSAELLDVRLRCCVSNDGGSIGHGCRHDRVSMGDRDAYQNVFPAHPRSGGKIQHPAKRHGLGRTDFPADGHALR